MPVSAAITRFTGALNVSYIEPPTRSKNPGVSPSPNREVVATGQMAEVNKERPKIPIVDVHVWSVNGKKTLSVFRKCHQRAIVVLEFSPDGQILLTIGQDDKNTLKAYTW